MWSAEASLLLARRLADWLHLTQPIDVNLLRAQILVIAVLMKWVLARSFTLFQWEALLLLVAGITVNQLNYCKCALCPFPQAAVQAAVGLLKQLLMSTVADELLHALHALPSSASRHLPQSCPSVQLLRNPCSPCAVPGLLLSRCTPVSWCLPDPLTLAR
jgi:hypothetical protein